LKKLCWNCLKFLLLSVIIISSSLAIYMDYKGSAFDPIREIQRLKLENRRDDALDLTCFFKENQIADQDKFARIEKALEYTASEKIKSFVWNGAIRGQVYDTPSALGAISTDLCVIGDIRDLGIQGWKYLTGGQDFDGFVTLLSAAGIGLSTTPFLDGTNALAKNIRKYLKKVPVSINKGLPKQEIENARYCEKHVPKLDDRFMTNIKGKDFVLYVGVLDLATQKGLLKLEVELLQFPSSENGNEAICRAVAEGKHGEVFSDIGDANPNNCHSMIAKHLIRMASTRRTLCPDQNP